MDPRDDLIGKVQSGEMTPDEAESEARRQGLKPLAFKPDAEDFDAIRQTFWTLPMAVAWIAYRTPDAVRKWWQEYRGQYRHWRGMAKSMGKGKSGYSLEPYPPASLARLRLNDASDVRPDRDVDYTMTVKEAADALFHAFSASCFEAVARDVDTGERHVIQAIQWRDLVLVENWDGETIRTRVGEGQGPVKYTDIVVPSGGVRGLWNTRPPTPDPVKLPNLWSIDRGGHMPLFCGAQWIATKGGSVEFEATDIERWKPAFAELLARISSGEVGATGMKNGMREVIPAHLFAAVPVGYPFAEPTFEQIVSDELQLQSSPYDEGHWSDDYSDTLEKFRSVRWTRIMLPCADVLRHWAFEPRTENPPAPMLVARGTGLAGRPPKSWQLIEVEFQRRLDENDFADSLTAEAEYLVQWLKDADPRAERPKVTTLKNKIRSVFRAAENARNKAT